jgi:hypothetical protein
VTGSRAGRHVELAFPPGAGGRFQFAGELADGSTLQGTLSSTDGTFSGRVVLERK